MKQLLLIAVLFVFIITTAFVTNSTNENTDPFRSGTPLSVEEVSILRGGDSEAKRELSTVLTGDPTGVTAMIVVCYGDPNIPGNCFVVKSLDSCDNICPDDDNDGCNCYEI